MSLVAMFWDGIFLDTSPGAMEADGVAGDSTGGAMLILLLKISYFLSNLTMISSGKIHD